MADLEEEEKLIETAFAEHRRSTLDRIELADVRAALSRAQHRRRLRYALVLVALLAIAAVVVGLVLTLG